MRSSVFWALVRKDMYVLRTFSIAGLVTGLLALGAMLIGKVGFAIGGILYLTANVAGGIMIAMYGFMNDRKEQTRLFALSLPISGQRHELAKLTAVFLSYGIPWLILTLVGAVLIPLVGIFPRGFMVYALLVQGCCLALFGFLIAAMFIAKSERLAGLAVITTNLLFSLFMVTLGQPAISGSMHGPRILWTDVAVWLLTGEIGLLVVALLFAISIIFRTRDHL
jgi:ABC-2 type transport system permease protein